MDPVETNKQEQHAEIKIRVIENAIIIKTGVGWISFPDWAKASECVGRRIDDIVKKRRTVRG